MDWKEIIDTLKDDPDLAANKELACLVTQNDTLAVNYYLREIGFPIMEHIEKTITHYDVMSEYYMFLSDPFDKNLGISRWHRVGLYRGINCKLNTYTSNITCRYFCKKVNSERRRNLKEGELLEFVDYESLLKCETAENEDEGIQNKCVRAAYKSLKEREREALRLLIIEKKSALEAFCQLSKYMTPRAKDGLTSEQIKAGWSDKQKQDAISLLKGRALEHLQNKFIEVKNKFFKYDR